VLESTSKKRLNIQNLRSLIKNVTLFLMAQLGENGEKICLKRARSFFNRNLRMEQIPDAFVNGLEILGLQLMDITDDDWQNYLKYIINYGAKMATGSYEIVPAFENCVEKQMIFESWDACIRSSRKLNIVARYYCCDSCTVFINEMKLSANNLTHVYFRCQDPKFGSGYQLFRNDDFSNGGWLNRMLDFGQ
jgi:hypothetical protein